MLLTGQSSHSLPSESVWQAGIRMLINFGGRRQRVHRDPPVLSINSDGSLALVFQPGGRSILALPRGALYDRCQSPCIVTRWQTTGGLTSTCERRSEEPDFLFLTCSNQIQDVCWSARAPGNVAVCSSTTCDVEVWSATTACRLAVLNGQSQITAGSVGFLAIQTLKVRLMPHTTQHLHCSACYTRPAISQPTFAPKTYQKRI